VNSRFARGLQRRTREAHIEESLDFCFNLATGTNLKQPEINPPQPGKIELIEPA
jgi:hypothetical protein